MMIQMFTVGKLFTNCYIMACPKTYMKRSLRRLANLLDDFKVYPGHGPKTTIGEEKRSNPFLIMEW